MEHAAEALRHRGLGLFAPRWLSANGRCMALIGLAGTAAIFLAGCEAQGVTIRQPLQLLVTHTETGEPVPAAVIKSIAPALARDFQQRLGFTLCEVFDSASTSTYDTDEQGEVSFDVTLTYSCLFDCNTVEPEELAHEGLLALWRIQSNDVEDTFEVEMADMAVSAGEFFTVEVLSVAEPTVDPPGPLHGD